MTLTEVRIRIRNLQARNRILAKTPTSDAEREHKLNQIKILWLRNRIKKIKAHPIKSLLCETCRYRISVCKFGYTLNKTICKRYKIR